MWKKVGAWVVAQWGLVWWRLKTALQDGVGWFFGAVVCLALAGNCFSLSFNNREQQKQEVEKLVQARSQVGRNEMHGVLGSSLASPLLRFHRVVMRPSNTWRTFDDAWPRRHPTIRRTS